MKSTGEVMGIDYTFEAALAKAIMAAGLALPPKSGILFSIADRDKAEALPIIRKLAAAGAKLYATEGTAAMIEAAGIPVKMTSKKLTEGHPNIIDLINDGTISGVVNTITGGHIPVQDGFQIRRAAAEKRIPCFTSLDTIRAATETISHGVQSYTVQPLPDYRNKRPS
jgi:carbamoyl-phosphate synthase large subunit